MPGNGRVATYPPPGEATRLCLTEAVPTTSEIFTEVVLIYSAMLVATFALLAEGEEGFEALPISRPSGAGKFRG